MENLTIVNTYNGIRVGPGTNGRHGSAAWWAARCGGAARGNTHEIGRVENVHWHCDFWASRAVNGNRPAVYEYMWKNLEAFTFGRTDWEYVTNTFVFPVKTGYRFIKTAAAPATGSSRVSGRTRRSAACRSRKSSRWVCSSPTVSSYAFPASAFK